MSNRVEEIKYWSYGCQRFYHFTGQQHSFLQIISILKTNLDQIFTIASDKIYYFASIGKWLYFA